LAETLNLVTKSEIHLVLEKAVQKNEQLRPVVKKFRVYFEEFWMPTFDFWKVSRFQCSFGNLKRTNNCLERYNRQLNDKFPLAHPSIIQFASVVQQEQLIRSIEVGVQLEEEVLECEFPSCEEFRSWYLDIVLDEPDINPFFENHDSDNELGASYVDVSDSMDLQEENARHDETYHSTVMILGCTI
jgi:hypothetical protein